VGVSDIRTAPGAAGGLGLGKYVALMQVSLINRLAYAGDALARASFMAMVLFIFSQLWRQALPGGSDMAGFTASQMVWYLMVTESLALSRPAIEGAITEDVKSGNIAYQLIRPYGYVGYYLSLAMGEFLLRWPVNLLTGALLALMLAGAPSQSGACIFLSLLSAFGGAILSFLFTIGLALTASAMEYRASFISQVVFMFLNDVLLLFFWWVLFSRLPSLNSWQMRDVVILYGVGASTFAFQAILFGHSFALARTIAEGGLDYYLVLPRRPLWHVLISRSSASAWGDLLFGLVAYAWAVGGEARKLLLFPFFLVCGGLVSTAYGVLAGSLAFFWGNSESFSHQLYGALLNFSLYPEGIFPGGVRVLLYTVVPAGFVTYLPVRMVRHFTPGLVLAMTGGAVVAVLLTCGLFYRGLRRYESGNLLVTRL
jgi:ABC-2 type transport system permease protein